MGIPTLRPKNQVTLPGDVVKRAGLHEGEALEFTARNGVIIIKPYAPPRRRQRPADDEDWLTKEVMDEIDRAAREKPVLIYEDADNLIAALRRG